MPASPARAAVFNILLRVEKEDAYASELLHSARYAKLSSADHGLATEMVMGVLRWRSWLDQQIAERSSLKLTQLDPEVLTALRLAAYQLTFLDRVPQRAAIHESVELVKHARKRSAVSFTNAVLRKFAGSMTQVPAASLISKSKTSQGLATASAHPEWLVQRWVQEFGLEVARKICSYDQRIPETEIRIRGSADEEELRRENIQLAPGKLLSSARRVVAGKLTESHAFHEGWVTIQDEAS